MAVETSPLLPSVDARSGFCCETKTFHSLRPAAPLLDESLPLSASAYALSLLPSSLPSNRALIDAAISYPEFVSRVRTLAASLRSHAGLSKGDVAFVLSSTHLNVPLLYFALLHLGVIVSPANPLSTAVEISHQIRLSKPSVTFATTAPPPFCQCLRSLPPPPSLPSNPALIDTAISYPEFVSRVRTLAASLRSHAGLSKGDVAFVLSPTRLDVPPTLLRPPPPRRRCLSGESPQHHRRDLPPDPPLQALRRPCHHCRC